MRLTYLLCALCAVFTLNASAAIPASEQTVAVEFYHAQFDHYFITADPNEIKDLDTGVHKGWTRTGYRFSIMKAGSSYAGTSPVCRFYSPTMDTHFYSAKKAECDAVKEQFGNTWIFESDEVFRAFEVDPETGACAADTTSTFRLYNNRPDANHRREVTDAELGAAAECGRGRDLEQQPRERAVRLVRVDAAARVLAHRRLTCRATRRGSGAVARVGSSSAISRGGARSCGVCGG